MALYTEDGLYYKGVILELLTVPDTPHRPPNHAFIRFPDYGNEQITPFEDLWPEERMHELQVAGGDG